MRSEHHADYSFPAVVPSVRLPHYQARMPGEEGAVLSSNLPVKQEPPSSVGCSLLDFSLHPSIQCQVRVLLHAVLRPAATWFNFPLLMMRIGAGYASAALLLPLYFILSVSHRLHQTVVGHSLGQLQYHSAPDHHVFQADDESLLRSGRPKIERSNASATRMLYTDSCR